jgi:hypothetical protein
VRTHEVQGEEMKYTKADISLLFIPAWLRGVAVTLAPQFDPVPWWERLWLRLKR